MSKHELVHGATIDMESDTISLPIGSVTLNFSIEEWYSFFEIIDDVNTVINTNTIESITECPSCHTKIAYVHYEEPSEEDIN